MPQERCDLDTVRGLALALEGVEEAMSRGVSWYKANGKLMVCPAINKSAEPRTLVAVVGFEERDRLIAEDPEVYYLTDHYADHPSVLVRLSRIREDALGGLIEMAWRHVNAKRSRGKKAKKRG